MAKQSNLFNFFTKSPPPLAKPKPSSCPAEADLPSSVKKSNSSPKEQAKETAQQKTPKTTGVKPKSGSKPTKAGFTKLFGDKAAATKPKYVSVDTFGGGVIAGIVLYRVMLFPPLNSALAETSVWNFAGMQVGLQKKPK